MQDKREIVLDTETTGLDPEQGDRIIEIGCVEIIDGLPTGRTYHQYINPANREVDPEAAAVHGLTREKLKDCPIFAEIIGDFTAFIGTSPLVIHNAAFDIGFINAELKMHGFPIVPKTQVIDTLTLAQRRFPGSPASLDALCKRFQIDNSARDLHGALLDAQLLADVYLELIGGRQHGLSLAQEATLSDAATAQQGEKRETPYTARKGRILSATPEESMAHAALLEKLKDPLWAGTQ